MDISEQAESLRKKAEEANSTPVRVALFGQPGAGKSSIINAIVGEKIATVGSHTDTTVTEEKYTWNGLYFCDLPGYGTAKFPAETFFKRFDVLSFDIFLCVSSEKFTEADTAFWQKLKSEARICIFVRNKIDSMFEEGKTREELCEIVRRDIHRQTGGSEPVVFTSCVTKEGMAELNEAIMEALGGFKKIRFLRSAKAYTEEFLNKKREACQNYALLAGGAVAVANAVPVPGVGFSADVTALIALLTAIRMDFGLTEVKLQAAEHIIPALGPVVKEIVTGIGRAGAMWMLKRFAGQAIAAEAVKYIPVVGQLIASSISFLTIRMIVY